MFATVTSIPGRFKQNPRNIVTARSFSRRRGGIRVLLERADARDVVLDMDLGEAARFACCILGQLSDPVGLHRIHRLFGWNEERVLSQVDAWIEAGGASDDGGEGAGA